MQTHLAKRLKEVLLDGKWIANTNFKEQITSINFEQANTKLGSLNTIAQLTFHITYYLKGVLQVFEGGTLDIRDKYSFDMPALRSENDWQNLVNDFMNYAEAYIQLVEKMDEAQLQQPFVKEEYGTYLRNIEAQIEHSYYHLGQITLIKKLILQKP
jgi:uncharacterized damage-inducible protein DinB